MTKSNHRSTNETGDIKNLENFSRHITHLLSLEPKHNPMNEEITPKELDKHLVKAWAAYEDLRTKRMDFIQVTNRRQYNFEKLPILATQLNGAVIGGGYDKKTIDDFKTITNKIQGRLSKPKTNESEDNQELERAVSNSQKSYDQLIDNLADAVRFLERLGTFTPNEEELQIPALEQYMTELRAVNNEYFNLFKPFSTALDVRDEVFYDSEQGFIQKIMTSREYIKSVWKYNSTQYKFATSIHFRTFKRKGK